MSEQKLISPLLDGFAMGNPMSDHDGVRCCPAIKENTEKKYIVKIISVPASQVQMDALLLAGAYKDPAGAMDYYKEVAEDTAKEAELLQKLSRQEGFLPYEAWQIEPITKKRLGYEVYLLSSYKRSLEKHLRRNPITHLEAVNLGLDLCAAFSVCRQAGAMYVDLKPSNIFMSEKKQYRIGDLGFLSLDALSYSTLPDKYRSAYTPPEFDDPMAPLNTTADTYSLGMILYQLYNDSQLPSREDILNGTLPTPVNADYEIAEIILKAIHPDPQQRWQDPAAMRQALVGYMQRNAVNDVPITPYTPLEIVPEDIVQVPKQTGEPSVPAQPPAEVSPAEEESPAAEETPAEEEISVEEEPSLEEVPDAEPAAAAEPEETTGDAPPREAPVPQEAVPAEEDESAPGEEDALALLPHEMSEELSRIVAKADDLIAHETPEGVVIPEVPDLPDPFDFIAEDFGEIDDSDIPLDPVMDEPEEETPPVKEKKKKKKKSRKFVSPEGRRRVKRFFSTVLTLLVLAALGFCGYLYYQNSYLQTIDGITIDGTEQELTVTIDAAVDEGLLSVVCSDSYGNVRTQSVSGGKASFSGLLPDTMYTIRLEIRGLHKLTGHTSDVFTTDANTNIVSFTAVTGPEDGSVVLNFTVDGDEPKEWTVTYTAEGEETHRKTFSGHSETIKSLTVGKVYTFTLTTDDDLSVSGMTSMEFMASRLILAENLTVTSENGTDMTVYWNAPGDVVVDSWDVRCYNDQGYEVQFTVDETQALIPGIDLTTGYTVEVTASGMTQPARATISQDPINVTQFTIANAEDPSEKDLELSWQFEGNEPEGGWLLLYTIDGNATPNVVKCEKASAVVSPRIPGAKYRFMIQAVDGTTVLNSVHTYECPEAESFNQYSLSADTVTAQLLKTPEDKDWRYETISDSEFTDTFAIGDRISIVLRAESPFYLPGAETKILYVFRDTHGNVISDLVYQDTVYWKSIWSGGDAKAGELDVPIAPTNAGSYVLDLYIDGMTMAQFSITIE